MTSFRICALSVLVGTLLSAAACGSSRNGGFDDSSSGGGASSSGSSGSLASSGGADGSTPTGIGTLTGTVFAPEGTVPISNALLYLATSAPGPQEPALTCDKCVQLTSDTPYTYSKADGTFTLPVYSEGARFLVVQKGHFRRVRPLTVAAGSTAIPGDMTKLPGAADETKGDEIPRIGVTFGGFDKIELSLMKLGITQFDRYGKDPFNDPKELPPTVGEEYDLINSPAKLAQYHIVMLPCATGGLNCGAPTSAQKDNLKGFVGGGGKLYVTDYSYEFVNQTWPGFIVWKDKDGNDLTKNSAYGAACQPGAYTKKGTADDTGLSSWLNAIGETNFDLKDSWTIISKTAALPGQDQDGNPVTITPKTWMTSDGTGPSTVSFEDRCGRVLFSTYHAEGDVGDALLAQEKALLYILLEVGVCVGPPPPPR